MKIEKMGMRHVAAILAIATVGLLVLGCPASTGKSEVTVLLSSSENKLASAVLASLGVEKDVVDINDVESLIVTVTEVALDYAGTSGEDDGDKAGTTKIVVFEGSQDVNVIEMTMTGLSSLLAIDTVPAGLYTKIRIAIEDPRLVLKSDLDTVIEDIHLTANGHLFISQSFELPEGQTSLLVLDFGGLHLVQNGNGKFTLTPQLRADITVQSAEVALEGVIESIDVDADTMTLSSGGVVTTVNYAGASIFLPADTDTPTGVEADLVVGLTVQVEGLLNPDSTVDAAAIRIIS